MTKARTVKKQAPMQMIFSRFMLIVAFFVIWILIIGVRLVHLQINQYDIYREKALSQRRLESKSKTLRGKILDRADKALAVSVKVKSLYADPRYIDDVQTFSKRVAASLKLKPQDVADNILDSKQKQRNYVILARKLEEDVVRKVDDQLKDLQIKDTDGQKFKVLYWKEEQKRSYPLNSLAAQVIGFSDMDDKGKAGIEFSQEQNLRGAVIKTWKDRDRLGRVYEESEDEEREPPKNIVLTISSSIQYKVEEALKNGVEAARAKSGIAIVLDPKTGEILAMANYPTFDLNKFNEVSQDLHTNRAVQHAYTPGSVFKLVTYGSALEEKRIGANDMLDCSKGVLDVAGHIFKDKHCLTTISPTDAFAISSNIGAIRTGQKLGKEKFYSFARRFGFGETTGVELPAEAKGIIRSPEKWNGDSLASMSIGYEINVTALQSASAFATIANDGVRVKPHIIKEIRQADGKVVSAAESESIQVVSPEAARSLRQMMQKVVLSGTGKRAQLNGYTSAGKTGTAWKYDDKLKKINDEKYVSSFIGFAPFDKPSVVIAVILDEPQGALRDGGQVSAPIFREIAEQILPELGVIPDGFARQEVTKDIVESKEFDTTGNTRTADKITGKRSAESEKTEIKTKLTKNGKVETESKPKTKEKTISVETKSKNEIKNKSSGKTKT